MNTIFSKTRSMHPEHGLPGRPARATISVVIPMHNEAGSLDQLLGRLIAVLDRLRMRTEIVCVDDGSFDDTAARVGGWCQQEPRVKLLRLSRNFGKEVALAAGLAYSKGEAVVLMDADLQHPPELIESFVAQWRNGYDMVYGVRQQWHGVSRFRKLASRGFYRIFSTLTQTQMPTGAGDFRLLDRRVADALNACSERSRFTKGLYAWVGFRHVGVPFDAPPRGSGRSGWGPFALWRFAIDAITSFSMMPLRIWSYLGAAVSLFALSYGGFIVIRTLIFGRDVPGYASLIAAITFFSGVQLIGLGVIGEYLGRVFTEVKRRPLFVVAETVGFEEPVTACAAAGEPPLDHADEGRQRIARPFTLDPD